MKNTLFLLCLVVLFSCKEEEQPAWKTWTVNDPPVFQGQFPLVGDPSVIKENNVYRMFYTGFDAYRTPQGPEICQTTSPDGITWTNVSVNDKIEGRMLYTNSNNWSNAHETSDAIKFHDQYFLYFIGYQDAGGGVFGSGAVSIGLVTSIDGEHFTELQPEPVITGAPNGFDRDAMSSPSVIMYNDSLLMIYSGFCYSACGPSVTSNLLAAMSHDGIHWIKKTNPMIRKEEIAWASKGVAEAELIAGPDHLYYLFMTSIDEPHVIGVARSETPFGPWDVNPQPIIQADKSFSVLGAVAPSVLIENNKVRLWYHGNTSDKIQIGYAEASWPLKD